MAKGSYGFSLVKSETSRRCQQLLFSASPTYFPKNASVLLIDNQNHPKSLGADRFDFKPRENSRKLFSKAATGNSFPYLANILWVAVQTHILILFFGEIENKLLNNLELGTLNLGLPLCLHRLPSLNLNGSCWDGGVLKESIDPN